MRPPRQLDSVVVAAGFVAWSAACTVSGWGLSLAGKLNAASYAVVCGVALLVGAAGCGRRRLAVRLRRWRRTLPAAYLLLLLLAAAGSVHRPNSIDALTYRLPRVLHWLDAGHWHWLAGEHARMNYSATGAEWLSAPVLALAHSARPLVLYNLLAFALLPGLLFVTLRGLGATGRAAWRWMWLAPCALGAALQAGGIGNDLLGLTYLLAAGAMAARAGPAGRQVWLAGACIALGLMTGIKASNLALVPAGLVCVVVAASRTRARRIPTWRALAWGGGLAVVVSAAPTLLLNHGHTGAWSGDPANVTRVQVGSPAAAMAGNSLMVVVQNAAPPVLPGAAAWTRWSDANLLPAWRAAFGDRTFPRFTLRLAELPQEEWAGLGLCFVALLLTELVLARTQWRRPPPVARWFLWLGVGGWAAFFALMGSEMPARLLLPFYLVPLAAVAITAGGLEPSRRPVWRVAAGLTVLAAGGALLGSPARPLLPVATLLRQGCTLAPDCAVLQRAERTYRVYRERGDMLAPVRSSLAPTDRVIGFLATDDDSDWSLWQPLGGGRRVVLLGALDDAAGAGVDAVVVRADAVWPGAVAEWRTRLRDAGFVATAVHELQVKASRPTEWWLVARRMAR